MQCFQTIFSYKPSSCHVPLRMKLKMLCVLAVDLRKGTEPFRLGPAHAEYRPGLGRNAGPNSSIGRAQYDFYSFLW